MPDSGVRSVKRIHVIDYLLIAEFMFPLLRFERWFMFPVMFDQFKLVDAGVELACQSEPFAFTPEMTEQFVKLFLGVCITGKVSHQIQSFR